MRFIVTAARSMFAPLERVKLGRWNRCDNVDIKATLANIDSCGDRLCGDVIETQAVIERYCNGSTTRRSPQDTAKVHSRS